MSKNRKNRSSYIPRKMVSDSQKKTPTRVSLPCEYHQKIATLPLSRFKDCLCNNNVYALVISGHPEPIALLNAWKNIQIEYADQIGDEEHKLYCTILKQVLELETNYKLVLFCIEALKIIFMQNWADELNNLVDANFDYEGKDKFKNLDNAFNRAKSIKINIDIQTERLNVLRKNENSDKRTAESFDSNLITLSDHAGFRIADDITVFEYCERISRLNKFIETQKRKPYAGHR